MLRAVAVEKPEVVRVAEVERPAPGPGKVVVKVGRCRICGTDKHIYKGSFLPHYPLIRGASSAGSSRRWARV